ncbi:chemotaxis protein CheE [uncultured Brevundimonas sp.]|uniref:chemotaxis protein CheE n=1 Tax=uncultured Brevundimonas sp. TaxID=213418 RepID=UPI00262C8515|nr:chemotaxis protein CheE [uncultured Brevundimonas sp.]
MTTVITHNRRRSRLSDLIDQPGGLSTVIALKQARANLSEVEGESVDLVSEAIQKLSELPAPQTVEEVSEALLNAYRLTTDIIDSAGPFDRDDLCRAATNLCDLLDGSPTDRMFDWRIITVHAQSFRLLLNLPLEEKAARQQVLDSLKEVLRAKLGG